MPPTRSGARAAAAALAAVTVVLSLLATNHAAASGPPALLDCDDSNGPTEDEVNPAFAGAASTETYTCKLTDAQGQSVTQGLIVDAEVIDVVNDPDSPDGQARGSEIAIGGRDYRCNVDTAGICTINVTQMEGEVGTTRVCFYHGDDAQSIPGCSNEPWDEAMAADGTDGANDMVDMTRLTWEASGPVASRLDVENETFVSPLGGSHSVTAKVYDQFGQPFNGNTVVNLVFLHGSPSWTSDADVKTCNTAGSSTCSYAWGVSHQSGSDYLCAYLGTILWRKSNSIGPTECEDDTLNDPDDEPGVFDTPSVADRFDLVRALWGDTGRLDCDDPNGDTEIEKRYERDGAASSIVYTCKAQDAQKELLPAGTTVYGEATTHAVTTPNDPDDGTSYATPDFSCTLTSNGTCQITVAQSELQIGRVAVCFYLYVDYAPDRCREPVDAPELDSNTGAIRNSADLVYAEWVKRSTEGTVTVTPTSADRKVGTKHVLTMTVYDKNGAPLADDTYVKLEFFGGSPNDVDGTTPHAPDRGCRTTWSSPSCSVAFTSDAPGRDLVCVWINWQPAIAPDGQSCQAGGFSSDPASQQDQKMTQVQWSTSNGGIDTEPENATVRPGHSHSVTTQVFDENGALLVGNTTVRFELFAGSPTDVDGNTPATPDLSCTTSSSSTCSMSYKITRVGADRLCAWIGATPSMAGSNRGGTCDGEGLTDSSDSAGSFQAPVPADDDVDVVTVKLVKTKDLQSPSPRLPGPR